jgi:hypothetical protein
MGSGTSKAKPVKRSCAFKSYEYRPSDNNLVVVYGSGRTLDDCITLGDTAGARVQLIDDSSHDMLCIIKRQAHIRCDGVFVMRGSGAVLRMGVGASIEVGMNARLIITGMLLMEAGARLVVESGCEFSVQSLVHVTCNMVVDCDARCWYDTTISIPYFVKPGPYGATIDIKNNHKPTWCSDELRFLVQLICTFSFDRGMPDDLLVPLILQPLCRQYGVLFVPKPYVLQPRLGFQVEF